MAILRLAALGVIVSMVAAQDVKEQCNTLLKTLLPSAAEVHTEGKNVTSEGPDPAVLKGFLEACPIMGPLPASAVQISAQLQKPEYASLKSMYSRLLFCKPETLVPSVRLIPHENKKSNKLKKVRGACCGVFSGLPCNACTVVIVAVHCTRGIVDCGC